MTHNIHFQIAEIFTKTYYPQYYSRFKELWEIIELARPPLMQPSGGILYLPKKMPAKEQLWIDAISIIKVGVVLDTEGQINKDNIIVQFDKLFMDNEIDQILHKQLTEVFKKMLINMKPTNNEVENLNKRKVLKEEDKESEKKEYTAWTKNGKKPANHNDIDNFRKTLPLFVDDDENLAYTYGKPIVALQKSPQGYQILACLLEGYGGTTPKDIFRTIYPDKIDIRIVTDMKEKLATPIDRLEKILEDLNIGTIEFRGNRYFIETEFNYVMARKVEVNL